MTNRMQMTFYAVPENESLARTAVSAFILPVNPTLEVLSDVKTAISEAVTNSIIHGYPMGGGEVALRAELNADGLLALEITDRGVGIRDVDLAMQAFYSGDPASERSGMGFTIMQSFMDDVQVVSRPGSGTTVRMQKHLLAQQQPALMA